MRLSVSKSILSFISIHNPSIVRTARFPFSQIARAMSTQSASVSFITGNANKLREVKQILADTIPDLQSLSLDLPELQGPSATFITREKAKVARSMANGPILVEDTALCFNALNSLPGPYIKWFLESLGHDGLNKLLAGHEDKSAYALCIFAYVQDKDSEPILFEGRCHGRIVPARGPNAFGWDPIFEPSETEGNTAKHTFAEMDKDIKNSMSHRAKALAQVKEFFAQNPHLLPSQ